MHDLLGRVRRQAQVGRPCEERAPQAEGYTVYILWEAVCHQRENEDPRKICPHC